MNILFVTPYVPSQIRTRPYNLIRSLVRLGHRLTLLTAAGTSPEEQEQVEDLRDWGVNTEAFPVPLLQSLRNCIGALPKREPLQAVYCRQQAMEKRVTQLSKEGTFDVAHIEHLRAARLVRAVQGIPTVYDSVDCISLLFEQAAKRGARLRSRLMTTLDLSRTRPYEAWLLTQYDQVVITSRRDKEALEELARRYLPDDAQPAPVTVITNGVDLEYFQPRPQEPSVVSSPPTVIFTGKMSYHANVASVLYFTRQVLPHIWEGNPEVRFQIVGKDPPETVQQLAADERIHVTGYVEDMRPYLAQATVAVCPVPYSVGIQNKVLEAMAMGVPVVCTTAAFDGLKARSGLDVLVGTTEEEFAQQVLRVVSNGGLAEDLTTHGRKYVESHHNWDAKARRLVGIYEKARSSAGHREKQAQRSPPC